MIVLLNPFTRRGNDTYLPQWEVCEHLGIASLMGALRREGLECSVVNAYLREYTEEEAVDAIVTQQPTLIGVSILNENYAWAKAVMRRLKQALPSVPIVVGGYFPTILGERVLTHNADVDFLIQGDGETSLVALARCLAGSLTLSDVPGLVYRDVEAIKRNPLPPVTTVLDDLAFPARDDAAYAVDILKRAGASPAIRLMTSRGCSYRCAFCNIVEYAGKVDEGRRRVRSHSPEYVCDQIEDAIREFGIRTFVISDDVFMDRSSNSKSRVEQFLDELERRQLSIKFACQFRLDGFDRAIFERMLENGLVAVALGVESIEQDTMDFLVKDTTNDVMLRSLEALSQYSDRVNISLYMLIYHPFTTMDEIQANYEFLTAIGYLDVATETAIARKMLTTELQVFRGGRLEAQLASLGLLHNYDASALEPTILPFRYLDTRVPKFIAAVQEDRRSTDRPIRDVFEARLAEFLAMPGPTRAALSAWRAEHASAAGTLTRLTKRPQSAKTA